MTDHVSRMVNGWYQQVQRPGREREAVSSLVDSIHRMIREAERETRRRCAEVALHTAADDGSKVAQAIAALGASNTGVQHSTAWGSDPQT